jgi:Na+-translocating ferredoxin:NAD+ oxidoreductase RnfG subunit
MRPWFALIAVPAIFAAAEPAAAKDYLSVEQAQRALFPNASGFAPAQVSLSREQLGQIKQLSGTPQRTANPKVWHAVQGGRLIGWFIVDEVVGKHEFITYATGISPDGSVVGIEIMSYRESRGGEVMNPKWRALFRGKRVTDPFRLNKDIPNISGATLSSRNITDGVKRLLVLHKVALAGRS